MTVSLRTGTREGVRKQLGAKKNCKDLEKCKKDPRIGSERSQNVRRILSGRPKVVKRVVKDFSTC